MTLPELITQLRDESEFRTSILGVAQIKYPLAYAEYHGKKQPVQTIAEYFETECTSKLYLIGKFREREGQLRREKAKPSSFDGC